MILKKGDWKSMPTECFVYGRYAGDFSDIEMMVHEFFQENLSHDVLEIKARDVVKQVNLGMYVTVDPLRMHQRFGTPIEAMKQWVDETTEQFRQKMPGARSIHAFIHTAGYLKEDEILSTYDSAMHVGVFNHLSNLTNAVYAAMRYFVCILDDRMKHDFGLHDVPEGSSQAESGWYDKDRTWKDITEEPKFREYLRSMFIMPMFQAAQNGHTAAIDEINRGLVSFIEGSSLSVEVRNLYRYVLDAGKYIDIALVEPYTDKIAAVRFERYERAAQLAKEIERLRE
ncbi:hypothetical protein JXB02_06645 [Candidatus Woesearchaeota archaeon]|nr:hypothetical protein [Candidatus Woesearchaeota archaeon]